MPCRPVVKASNQKTDRRKNAYEFDFLGEVASTGSSGTRGWIKGMARAKVIAEITDQPSSVLRIPYLLSVMEDTGEIIAAARLLAPKL